MGEIKSAFERAMERTADIKSDPEALHKNEARTEGKRLFAKLREAETFDIVGALKSIDKGKRRWVRDGFYEVVKANLVLPQSERDLDDLGLIQRALEALVRDSGHIKGLIDQLRQFLTQYLSDRDQYIERLRQQYEPRIRQREQQLSQQYGRPVQIDPATDPEFAKILQENLAELQTHYRQALEGALAQLDAMIDKG